MYFPICDIKKTFLNQMHPEINMTNNLNERDFFAQLALQTPKHFCWYVFFLARQSAWWENPEISQHHWIEIYLGKPTWHYVEFRIWAFKMFILLWWTKISLSRSLFRVHQQDLLFFFSPVSKKISKFTSYEYIRNMHHVVASQTQQRLL